MMGPKQQAEPKLFYTGIVLADRVPDGHHLRRIAETIDFGFVRRSVAHCYGVNGQESVDPIVLMKLMILLYLDQLPSERELMKALSYRIDWLWFCGYDLDDTLPHHSVLSKARRRWGPEVFAELFGQVLLQCIQTGLVSGDVLHLDGSCIQGEVDMDRLRPVIKHTGQILYDRLEEDVEPAHPNSRLTACSDPEAGVTRKNGKTICGYKDHRAVDDAHGVVTATVTTDAATDEGHVLPELLAAHEANTATKPQTVVADKQYGTAANYEHLHRHRIDPCIPHQWRKGKGGLFGPKAFTYDREEDCFFCPAGQRLELYHRNRAAQRNRYRASGEVCAACRLRRRCTTSTGGRRVERHIKQDEIDWADARLSLPQRRRLMRRRKIRAEGSFAEAERYHFKRSRWRGLAPARIQNLLIASIQNLRILVKAVGRRVSGIGRVVTGLRPSLRRFLGSLLAPLVLSAVCRPPRRDRRQILCWLCRSPGC